MQALADYRQALMANASAFGHPLVRHPFLHYPLDNFSQYPGSYDDRPDVDQRVHATAKYLAYPFHTTQRCLPVLSALAALAAPSSQTDVLPIRMYVCVLLQTD